MTKEMLVLIGFVVYVLITSLFIEPNSLETVKYEIEDNQLQGIKVAFLSDFHLKRRDYKRLDKIIKYTNSHNPDIVLLGGDFANGKDAKSTMLPRIMASKLSLMNAPTYAVLGHNDWLVNGNEIKQALMSFGYVVVNMPWYKNYKLKDGVYTYPENPEKSGYHCVIIYGWDERGWLVQNSWGRSWGQNGRFVVPFDFKWTEAWAVTDTIVNGEELIKPQDNWFIKLFSKLINWFLNLFKSNK